MDVTSRQIKQILQIIEDKDADLDKVQWLLGGFLADLLDRDAKPAQIPRNMWRGLLGLNFQVVKNNTIMVTKSEAVFRVCFGEVCATSSCLEVAMGILLCKLSHSFGLGVRWSNDTATKAYRRNNAAIFPDYWEIFVTSD